MAWSQDDLDALNRAIAAGARRVKFSDGTEAEYHSMGDMLLLRQTMQGEIDAAAGTRAPRHSAVRFYRG